MLHKWLPFHLIELLPSQLRYLPHIIGICVSLLLLSLSGSIILRFLRHQSLDNDNSQTDPDVQSFPPICNQIMFGVLASISYFLFRSLLCKFFDFMPGVYEMELPLILSFLFVVERVRAGKKLVPSLQSLLVFLALLISTLVYGSWHFFMLRGLSSDPSVLSGYLELYRDQGEIPFVTSDINPTLPGYPPGIFLLLHAFANPLLPSISLVHIWIHLSAALALGVFAEWFILRVKLSFRWGFVALLGALSLKICSVPVDLNYIWRYLEGMPKRSLFCCLAIGFVLLYYFAKRSLPKSPTGLIRFGIVCLFLSVAWMLPFWVNPINFYISTLGMISVFAVAIWIFFQSKKIVNNQHFPKIPRPAWHIITIFLAAVLAPVLFYALQDPLLMSNSSLQRVYCSLYGSHLKFCVEPNHLALVENVAVKQLGTIPESTSFKDYLPVYLDYTWWLYPYNLQPVLSREGLIPFFLIVVFGSISYLVLSAKRKRMLILLSSSVALFFILNVVGLYAGIWLLHSVMPPSALHNLEHYAQQSYLNVWGAGVLGLASFSFVALARCTMLINDRYSIRYLRFSVLMIVFTCWIVSGVLLYGPLFRLARASYPEIGLDLVQYAEIYKEFNRVVDAGDKVLVPALFIVVPNGERWVFPETTNAALTSADDIYLFNNYPNFWLPSTDSPFEHQVTMCANLCDYMRKMDIDHFAWIGRNLSFCNMSVKVLADAQPCLKQRLVKTPSLILLERHKDIQLNVYSRVQANK